MKSIPKQTATLIIFSLIAISVCSQTKILSGIVRDSHSDEHIPFASVSFKNTKAGKLTDSSGSFTFYYTKWPSDTLFITSVGYQPFTYVIDRGKDSITAEIMMERGTFIEGVRVRVKVNKGLLLWR